MKKIGALFPAVLREMARDEEVAFTFLEEFWPRIVGRQMARRLSPIQLQGRVLRCAVGSRRWIQQLESMRPLLVRSINRFWEIRLVERIELQLRLIQEE